jgi:hypothetical protein
VTGWAAYQGEILASRSPNDLVTDGHTVQAWTELLEELVPGCEGRVSKAIYDWNDKLRSLIRRETGLRFTFDGRRSEAVPVRVLPGLPIGAIRALEEVDPRLLILLAWQNRLQRCAATLGFLTADPQTFSCLPDALRPPPLDEMSTSRDWMVQLDEWLRTVKLPEVRVIYSPDILGAYWHSIPIISIHWLAIGIYCAVHGTTPERVAPLVLAHELAHGYHHRGFDIDGVQWMTESFASSELEVIEGLAQFYAERVANELSRGDRGWQDAWDALLEAAPPEYKTHQPWGKIPHSMEVVRAALIRIRADQVFPVSSSMFEEALAVARLEQQ